MLKRIAAVAFCTFLFGTFSFGQAAEIGVLAGGIFTTDKTATSGLTIHTPTRISYEGVIAARVLNAHVAQVHFELPIVGTPTRTLEVKSGFSCATVIGVSCTAPASQNFSTIFVTPGLRLSASLPFFSPFISAGGGFAHYSGTATVGSSTVAAFQVGGGIDLSTPIPLIKFRAEIREFHTGTPNFTVGQNNVFAAGGLVLKF